MPYFPFNSNRRICRYSLLNEINVEGVPIRLHRQPLPHPCSLYQLKQKAFFFIQHKSWKQMGHYSILVSVVNRWSLADWGVTRIVWWPHPVLFAHPKSSSLGQQQMRGNRLCLSLFICLSVAQFYNRRQKWSWDLRDQTVNWQWGRGGLIHTHTHKHIYLYCVYDLYLYVKRARKERETLDCKRKIGVFLKQTNGSDILKIGAKELCKECRRVWIFIIFSLFFQQMDLVKPVVVGDCCAVNSLSG